jgi:long-chain fatty acid transport protein
MKKIYTLISVLIISAQLFAGGFQINEHGAKAMGMGGAFTAVANDASAIYWNPAGLTQLMGTNLMLGTTLIAPMSSFEGSEFSATTKKYETESQTFFPTHFFAAHAFKNGLAVGLGFTSPFGLGVKWPDNWAGRFLALDTELKVFTISPVVAYKISEELSLSAGLIYSWADVTIKQKLPIAPIELLGYPGGESLVTLDGKDNSAFGYCFGVMYKPIPEFSIGASFHSQLKYDFTGTATSTNLPPVPQLNALYPHGDISANLTAPYNLAVGLAYQVDPKLLLSFDFQFVGWSSYDTLSVNFAVPTVPDIHSPRLYDDSFILRLGGDYKVNDCFSVLAGIYYDKTPVKAEYMSPSLPEGNRLGFSAGIEYAITKKLSVSGSYLYIHSSKVDVTNSTQDYIPLDGALERFNGTYSSSASLGSLTLSYSF